MCIQEGVVDSDLLFKRGWVEWTKVVYNKLKPWYIGMRSLYNDPSYGYYAEFVYSEVMRLYPEIALPQDRFTSQ